jgi:hypothetical protein
MPALLAIFVLALLLRLWGIQFGLPYVYHADEHYYANTALNLGAGVLNNPPYAPVGFSNILFLEFATYFVFGRVQGIFGSAQQFEAAYRADPTVFYLLARMTTAMLGAATVLPVYWIGRTLRPELRASTGLLAAGLLATSFLHVRDSHYGVPDIAMTGAVTLSVALVLWGLHVGRSRIVLYAAVVAGVAISMKWTAIPVVLPVLLGSLVIRDRAQGETGPIASLRPILLAGLCIVLGFILTSLQVIINPGPYISEAFGQLGAGRAGGFDIWQVDTLPGWFFYIKVLSYGLGILPLVLAALGLIRTIFTAFVRRDTQRVLLLLFPVSYFIIMGATHHYFARYALPLVPFAALFAAEALLWFATWLSQRDRRLIPVVTAVLTLAAIALPLASSIRHDILLTRTDTRTLAKEWIEANIPADSRIAIDWRTHCPPLATPELPMAGAPCTYDVLQVGETGLSEHPLSWYQENGFDYLVSSSFISGIGLVSPERDMARRAFYASLPKELELLQAFKPTSGDTPMPFIFDEIYGPAVSLWQRDRPGPLLQVYQVQ